MKNQMKMKASSQNPNLTGLHSMVVLCPFLDEFFPGVASLAAFSLSTMDFFSADIYKNKKELLFQIGMKHRNLQQKVLRILNEL